MYHRLKALGSGGTPTPTIPTLDEVATQGNSTNKNLISVDAAVVLQGLADAYKGVLSHYNINFLVQTSGDQSTLDPFKFVIQVGGFGEWMEYNKNAIIHYDPDNDAYTKLDFTSAAVANRTYTFDSTASGVLALQSWVQSWVQAYVEGIATPQIVVSAGPVINLVPSKKVMIVTATEGVTDVTLPPIVGNEGLIILFTNDTTLSLNLNSNNGIANDMWDSKLLVNTKSVISGSVTRLTNDGVNYKTQ